MIDFIKVEIIGIDPEILYGNPLLDFHGRVNTRTGEMGKYYHAYYNGLEIKIYQETIANPKGRITLEGSLHKYWNHGAHNFNDFGQSELAEVLKDLNEKFGIEASKCILKQVEIGININPPIPTKALLNRCLIHRNKRLEWTSTKDEGYYIQTRYQRYIVKLYDKRTHYSRKGFQISEEIFRIEVKYLKMHDLNAAGIFTLQDLFNQGIEWFTNLLLGQWQKVLLYEEEYVSEKWRPFYSNPNYWLELINEKKELYKYHRKKFESINQKKASMKQLITQKIIEKASMLNSNTTQINPLSILVNKVVSEDVKNLHRSFCLVTGLNISMQKPHSKLLSHTGLKYYYKTDKKIFKELARKFLTAKWASAPFQVQITEIAHNIRNNFYNRKRQQELIYPPEQYNLFGENFFQLPETKNLVFNTQKFKKEVLFM